MPFKNEEEGKLYRKSYYLAHRVRILKRIKTWCADNVEIKKARDAEYYEKNKAQVLSTVKEYRVENKEKVARKDREKYFKNRLHRLEQSKKWVAKNRERANEMKRSWEKLNSSKMRELHAKRRAALLQAMPLWADRAAIKDVYAEAAYFGYVVDHIVPLQGKRVSGLHVWDNLQLLTREENSRKSNRWVP